MRNQFLLPHFFRGIFLCILLPPVLIGCSSYDVKPTQALHVVDDPLQKALYIQYAELALRETEEGNPVSARIYAQKAEWAAAGKAVPLPTFNARAFSEAQLAKLREGQQKFTQLFNAGVGMKMPSTFARAQAMLDCWIEELAENVDAGDIVACEQAFDRAVDVLILRLADNEKATK